MNWVSTNSRHTSLLQMYTADSQELGHMHPDILVPYIFGKTN